MSLLSFQAEVLLVTPLPRHAGTGVDNFCSALETLISCRAKLPLLRQKQPSVSSPDHTAKRPVTSLIAFYSQCYALH